MPIARIVGLFVGIAFAFGQDPSADAIQKYRDEIEKNPHDSLAHFLLAELLFDQHNFQAAANEFRGALDGDPHPRWIDGWAHVDLGEIFDVTGQRDRALREYRLALQVKDAETEGARALATQRLSEGVTAADISLHHVTSPFIRYVKTAKPLLKVPAEYSRDARIAELEGTVSFLGAIATDGSVRDLRLMQPLGLGLDQAAKAAAERWSFEPGAMEDGPAPRTASIEVDFLLSSKNSRWHLLRVAFDTPEGASSPRFLRAAYPAGIGVSAAAVDEARLVGAMGRQAMVTLSFDVDRTGHPARFRIERASHPVWGREAISVVSRWRFAPASKGGAPLDVPCTLDLAWGEKRFTHDSLFRAWQTANITVP